MIEPASPYHRILLLRAAPGTEPSRAAEAQARRWCEQEGIRVLIFFHGAGVMHADSSCAARWRCLAEWHEADLAVCSGSWARRHGEPPVRPFELSSLVAFWNQVTDAEEIACFGAADER